MNKYGQRRRCSPRGWEPERYRGVFLRRGATRWDKALMEGGFGCRPQQVAHRKSRRNARQNSLYARVLTEALYLSGCSDLGHKRVARCWRSKRERARKQAVRRSLLFSPSTSRPMAEFSLGTVLYRLEALWRMADQGFKEQPGRSHSSNTSSATAYGGPCNHPCDSASARSRGTAVAAS